MRPPTSSAGRLPRCRQAPRLLLHLVALLAALPGRTPAQAVHVDKLAPESIGWQEAHFGGSVALAGDLAIVASPVRARANGEHLGRVHVYRRSGPSSPWSFEQTLFPDGGNTLEFFGDQVATDGSTIAVGSAGATTADDGAVYMFRRANGVWTQEARLTRSTNATAGGSFGAGLDVEGDTVVVGDPTAWNFGWVTIYTRIGGNWLLTGTLVPGAGVTGAFGVAVAIDGARIAVGHRRHGASTGGEVQTFLRTSPAWNTWSREATLQPDSVPYGQYADDEFGTTLDLVGTTLLVGAPLDQNPAVPSSVERGAAFVFRLNGGTWTQYSRIDPITVVPRSWFGHSVALSGEGHATIGAPGSSIWAPPLTSEGAVVTFALTGGLWLQQHVLTELNAAPGDELGWDVAAVERPGGHTVLAGAYDGDSSGEGLAYSFQTTAQGAGIPQRIAEPALEFCGFGSAVSIDGDLAVVGAPFEDERYGDNVGAAYLFERTYGVWVPLARIAPSARQAGDRFGASVQVSGGVIAIAAPGRDDLGRTDVGAVSLYLRSSQGLLGQGTLIPSDGASFDGFGSSLSLAGSTLAVGAPGDNHAGGVDAGSVYVFTTNGGTWTQATKLVATDAAASDRFGRSVAVMSPTRVVVGAPEANTAGVDSGAGYVFDRIPIIGGVAWIQRTKLVPAALAAGDLFGSSVAASGAFVALGAPRDDVAPFSNAGSVYVYEATSNVPGMPGNTFVLRDQRTDPFGSGDAQFGQHLDLDGASLAVGVPSADTTAGIDAGKVVLHLRQPNGSWGIVQTIHSGDPAANERFGEAVALQGVWVCVGELQDTNQGGQGAGAAHLFDLWLGGGFGTSYCVAAVNSSGASGRMQVAGSPLAVLDNLVLRAVQLPAATTGFFLVSRTQGLVSAPGGALGALCVVGQVGRFVGPGQVGTTGTTGSFELLVDLDALPQPQGTVVALPGETWNFQAWFRDQGPNGTNSSFTDGIAVTLH